MGIKTIDGHRREVVRCDENVTKNDNTYVHGSSCQTIGSVIGQS